CSFNCVGAPTFVTPLFRSSNSHIKLPSIDSIRRKHSNTNALIKASLDGSAPFITAIKATMAAIPPMKTETIAQTREVGDSTGDLTSSAFAPLKFAPQRLQ